MSIAFDADPELPPQGGGRRLPLVPVLICVAAMAALSARTQLVRIAPRLDVLFEASGLPVNLAGLMLDRVTAKIVADGERRVLVVEGEIVNSSDRDESARPLAVSVRGEGNEALYTWTARAPRQRVAAGERAGFVARLASPPSGGASVVVEFDRSEAGAPKNGASQTRLQGSRTESQ